MKTRLTYSQCPAVACVILRSDFANLGNFVFFDSLQDAQVYADRENGRVVDECGLAQKHEAMHRAEGRDPRQTYGGRWIEGGNPEEIWAEEYLEAAARDFRNATVHTLEYDESEFTAAVATDKSTVRVEADEDPDFWVVFGVDARNNRLSVRERGATWEDEAESVAECVAESAMAG